MELKMNMVFDTEKVLQDISEKGLDESIEKYTEFFKKNFIRNLHDTVSNIDELISARKNCDGLKTELDARMRKEEIF